jgi:hypothetical protein
VTGQQSPVLRSATLRLLVIPCAICTAWLLEIFLLEGSMHTFERFDPPGIFLYIIIACIITGMVAPLLWIRNTFISGAVNMFQIGFRSLRRTFVAGVLTCSVGCGAVILFVFERFHSPYAWCNRISDDVLGSFGNSCTGVCAQRGDNNFLISWHRSDYRAL